MMPISAISTLFSELKCALWFAVASGVLGSTALWILISWTNDEILTNHYTLSYKVGIPPANTTGKVQFIIQLHSDNYIFPFLHALKELGLDSPWTFSPDSGFHILADRQQMQGIAGLSFVKSIRRRTGNYKMEPIATISQPVCSQANSSNHEDEWSHEKASAVSATLFVVLVPSCSTCTDNLSTAAGGGRRLARGLRRALRDSGIAVTARALSRRSVAMDIRPGHRAAASAAAAWLAEREEVAWVERRRGRFVARNQAAGRLLLSGVSETARTAATPETAAAQLDGSGQVRAGGGHLSCACCCGRGGLMGRY
jgi:hypothetical protein